jgi:peptide/nickel transport system substrate-binding protein
VPAHLLQRISRAELRRAAFSTAPVGNGPFRFASRRAGARWTFVRNDSFPAALGGPPRVRRLVVAVVDEATTKFAGLVSGELDVAGIAPTMAALAARDPSLRVLTYPVLFSTGIIFNPARAPFDDVRVRRAVDLAIRRDRIVDAAFAGLALPAGGPVPPANPLYAPVTPHYDPGAADSLLDAAGWARDPGSGWRMRNGMQLTFELLTVGSGDNATEQLIQADLAERGIQMEIRQREFGAFLEAARARPPRFDALIAGIPGDPSLAYLAAMYDSRAAGGALDYADYHTPALDSLFARAAAAPDTAAIRVAWTAVQRELERQLPAVWLYHSRGVQGLDARLQGVTMDLRGELATVSRWRLADVDSVTPASVAHR